MPDPLGLIPNAGGPDPVGRTTDAPDNKPVQGPAFKDVLMRQIEQVNKLQQDAETAIVDLNTGKRDDVDGVMIAKQKADLAFKMLLQVRNKLMDAYEEVKQMRV